MGFKEAIRTVLKEKYATFSGRASRSEYWWFQLFYFLLLLSVGAVFTVFALILASPATGDPSIAMFTVIGVLVLAMLIPQIALAVRRLHDRNLSGWWYLAYFISGFIPYINLITSIVIFVIFVLRGTAGPNRFGPDPLNPQFTAEVFA